MQLDSWLLTGFLIPVNDGGMYRNGDSFPSTTLEIRDPWDPAVPMSKRGPIGRRMISCGVQRSMPYCLLPLRGLKVRTIFAYIDVHNVR